MDINRNGAGPKAALPRGYLQACLLLSLEEHPSYGYELFSQVGRLGLRPADAGVIYRALHDLERRGLIVSVVTPGETRPDKRTYSTTVEGLQCLKELTGDIREVEHALATFDERLSAVEQVQPARKQVHAAA